MPLYWLKESNFGRNLPTDYVREPINASNNAYFGLVYFLKKRVNWHLNFFHGSRWHYAAPHEFRPKAANIFKNWNENTSASCDCSIRSLALLVGVMIKNVLAIGSGSHGR